MLSPLKKILGVHEKGHFGCFSYGAMIFILILEETLLITIGDAEKEREWSKDSINRALS